MDEQPAMQYVVQTLLLRELAPLLTDRFQLAHRLLERRRERRSEMLKHQLRLGRRGQPTVERQVRSEERSDVVEIRVLQHLTAGQGDRRGLRRAGSGSWRELTRRKAPSAPPRLDRDGDRDRKRT